MRAKIVLLSVMAAMTAAVLSLLILVSGTLRVPSVYRVAVVKSSQTGIFARLAFDKPILPSAHPLEMTILRDRVHLQEAIGDQSFVMLVVDEYTRDLITSQPAMADAWTALLPVGPLEQPDKAWLYLRSTRRAGFENRDLETLAENVRAAQLWRAELPREYLQLAWQYGFETR